MEELVKPWREQYRARDSTSFASSLQIIPALSVISRAPSIKSLKRRSQLGDLPRLTHGTDKLRSRCGKHNDRSGTPECMLADIPVLEIPKKAADVQPSSWCYAEIFNVPDLTTFSRGIKDDVLPDEAFESPFSADAVINHENTINSQEHLYRCLYYLSRGSESPMFQWHPETNVFVQRAQSNNIEDISSTTLEQLLSDCLDYGSKLKRLFLAKEHLFDNAVEFTTIHMALAVFLRRFLQHCIDQASHDIVHDDMCFVILIQCLDRVQRSLDWLTNILGLNSGRPIAECLKALSTVSLFDEVEKEVRLQTSLSSTHDKVARELLLCLAAPLMEEISSRIRLRAKPSLESGLLNIVDNATYTELSYAETSRPNLISSSCAQQILEVHKGIMVLEQHARADILHSIQKQQIPPLELSLRLDHLANWGDRQSSPCLDGQDLLDTPRLAIDSLLRARTSKEDLREDLDQQISLLSRIVPAGSGEVKKFGAALEAHNTENGSIDLDYALQVCLQQALERQAILINGKVLHVMSHDMKLREHLELLQQVYLLQNGLFTAKLREALFRGDGSSINLNSQPRKADRWPPRSAKVSIATRSLLGNTIDEKFIIRSGHTVVEKEFLGHLGLLMSLEDDDTSISRTSLDALSFLTFAFRPPKPVDLIITPRAVQLYSKINQFLLIILRMIDVVEKLTMDTRQYRLWWGMRSIAETFRIEATNFIFSFAAHIFETVITVNCQQFFRLLDQRGMSIESLRDAHLSMLEQICNSALLGSKMKELQSILRSAFEAVLSFSQIPAEQRQNDEIEVPKLYASFNLNTRKLIAVLAGAEATKDSSFASGISARFFANDFWSS